MKAVAPVAAIGQEGAIEPAEPIELAESIEPLAEPSAHVDSIDVAAPGEPVGPVEHQELAEPYAEEVETAAPIEQTEPIEPIHLSEPELEEPIVHVDPVETAVSPTSVEAFELAEPVEPSGQAAMATPVEPFEAVETVDLFELDEPDTGEAGVRRVYHLSDGSAFATELGQRLESAGYAVEPVESIDELSELLMCLVPQMLLVDASHMDDLDTIDRIRSDTQKRSQTQRRIQMVALAAQDNLEARRVAHRAGVDVLLFPPFDIADVVDRLHALDTATEEQQVRVLVVDDVRADAFFAQTVLNRAGMQAQVVNDPMKVLEAIKALHPDLVLMDLNMPFANGVEVTMLIREDPVFARLPIVFLSGESDPDSRLEAINAGGDDFLFKPIRPKNLIAAVRERMRRLHPISKP
jgi:CheY-like chemotaxis protein